MYWFYNDVYSICVWVHNNSNRNNFSILNFSIFSGGKIDLDGVFAKGQNWKLPAIIKSEGEKRMVDGNIY